MWAKEGVVGGYPQFSDSAAGIPSSALGEGLDERDRLVPRYRLGDEVRDSADGGEPDAGVRGQELRRAKGNTDIGIENHGQTSPGRQPCRS